MSKPELASVERGRQILFGAMETAVGSDIYLHLNPIRVLTFSHNIVRGVTPAEELPALDLSYSALLRRIRTPDILSNLNDHSSWIAAQELARAPIEMKELEEVIIEREEFINRFANDAPPRPST